MDLFWWLLATHTVYRHAGGSPKVTYIKSEPQTQREEPVHASTTSFGRDDKIKPKPPSL